MYDGVPIAEPGSVCPELARDEALAGGESGGSLGHDAARIEVSSAELILRIEIDLAACLDADARARGEFDLGFQPGLLLAMFARLGEQTGQLPLMLQRAARQLSTEVQRRAMHLATILEPLLIVVMGLVVMLIVLAVLLPIIQLNQLVR